MTTQTETPSWPAELDFLAPGMPGWVDGHLLAADHWLAQAQRPNVPRSEAAFMISLARAHAAIAAAGR